MFRLVVLNDILEDYLYSRKWEMLYQTFCIIAFFAPKFLKTVMFHFIFHIS